METEKNNRRFVMDICEVEKRKEREKSLFVIICI